MSGGKWREGLSPVLIKAYNNNNRQYILCYRFYIIEYC